MAAPWKFRILSIDKGEVKAAATPSAAHENPFGVVQGGFAASVLDIALGLVSISVLDDAATTLVSTTDLVVRYFSALKASTGELLVSAQIVHRQDRQIVAEAYLYNSGGTRFAYAQSNCLIAARQRA